MLLAIFSSMICKRQKLIYSNFSNSDKIFKLRNISTRLPHFDIFCNILLGKSLPLFRLNRDIAHNHQLDTYKLVDGMKVQKTVLLTTAHLKRFSIKYSSERNELSDFTRTIYGLPIVSFLASTAHQVRRSTTNLTAVMGLLVMFNRNLLCGLR